MGSDWFSDEGSESDVEAPDQAEANAKREALRRVQMVSRARERKAYWQKELAAERFDEFKPEMRRRIQVEQTLINGLEGSEAQAFVLLRTYQQDAVHMPSQPASEQEEERADLLERIQKASQRRTDLLRRLQLTPQRQGLERLELTRKMAKEGEYIDDLHAQIRSMR
jgi:hypothetical protein